MNNRSPVITAIIPVYNGERFLKDAVENILAQNYPSLELIIVDNGSRDRTEDIVKKLPAYIRYLKQENKGPASAMNQGIINASGDLLVFLDGDDVCDHVFFVKK